MDIFKVIFRFEVLFNLLRSSPRKPLNILGVKLSRLKNANTKRCVFLTQRTWTQALAPREVFKSQKLIAMRFLNASVLERKALNRNLSWGFPFGNLLPKTRVLKHRVLERKRRPNANASVLGTQRFRTLRGEVCGDMTYLQLIWFPSSSRSSQRTGPPPNSLSGQSLICQRQWPRPISPDKASHPAKHLATEGKQLGCVKGAQRTEP